MTLEISEQERELLLDLLKAEHLSLHDEVHHTDSYEYKQLLKQKLELLMTLKSRFEAFGTNATTV